MIGTMTIRGVPRGLMRDAWWFAEEVAVEDAPTPIPDPVIPDHGSPLLTKAAVVLAALLALGDFLFYGHHIGLSLALYAVAIFAASVALLPRQEGILRPAILLGLSVLPVIEYVQPLSVLLLIGGLVTSVAWLRLGHRGLTRTALHLAAIWPIKGVSDFVDLMLRDHKFSIKTVPLKRLILSWAFPIGGACILVFLLMMANPVMVGWVGHWQDTDLHLEALVRRILFWGGLGLMVWPFLCYAAPAPFIGPPRRRLRLGFGLNTASVTNALILFNLLLAMQSFLDITVLWGGRLPEGMSYASYARRGAYPLLVTALLAGAFALAARPHLDNRQSLTTLMMLWLGQNLLLTASAAYRLWAYIEAYGLTHQRVFAAIWMGLVAIGLCLIGWYIYKRRPTTWLAARGGGVALGTFYICAFINFAQIIADYNLTYRPGLRGVDVYYACSLGPMASAALVRDPDARACATAPQRQGWRDWGFRNWRVTRLLAAEEALHEDIGGR